MEIHRFLFKSALCAALLGNAPFAAAQPAGVQPEAFDCTAPLAATAKPLGMSGDYIKRVGNELRDGASTKPFKFVSFNTPSGVLSGFLEQSGEGVDTVQTAFAQEDLLKTVFQLTGGRGGVVRLYTFSIAQPNNSGRYRHVMTLPVTATDKDEERVWQGTDRFLCLANKYRVRVVIPLINFHYEDFAAGGVDDFAALVKPSLPAERAARGAAFYKDAQVRKAFKDFVGYALSRRNTYTGQLYKDDKAVLGWQLGNELLNLDSDKCVEGACAAEVGEWIKDIAGYIKTFKRGDSSAPLVIDPRIAFTEGVSDFSTAFNLKEPAAPNYWSMADLEKIDVLSNHYYKFADGSSYSKRLANDLAALPAPVRASKAFMVGEMGMNPFQVNTALSKLSGSATAPGIAEFLDSVIATPGVSGVLFWELVPRHDRNPVSGARGGFQSPANFPEPSYFRWPGFADTFADPKARAVELYREIDLLKLIWLKARTASAVSYSGTPVTARDWGLWDIAADKPAVLLDGVKRQGTRVSLVWSGVTGARFYDVARQEKSAAGTWSPARTLTDNAQDGASDGVAMYPGSGAGFVFVDNSAAAGKTYRYFVRGKTPATKPNLSAWSCAVEVGADGPKLDCAAKP